MPTDIFRGEAWFASATGYLRVGFQEFVHSEGCPFGIPNCLAIHFSKSAGFGSKAAFSSYRHSSPGPSVAKNDPSELLKGRTVPLIYDEHEELRMTDYDGYKYATMP